MDNKVSSMLEKALQERSKGNLQKAFNRLIDVIGKFPDEIELYLEAADVCLEGGETLQATNFLKKAQNRFQSEQGKIDTFAREKLKSTNDLVLGKFLLEQAIKKRDLDDAIEILEVLQDRAVRELLQRTRTKKQSLTSAEHGGYSLKIESLINTMSEALLCVRLGRMKEAVRSFLQILDEKPVENEILEPFFAGLEKKYPKAGRVRYVHACSLIHSQQYDKAMARLVAGTKLEPKISDDCLARLRELTDKLETPPDSVQQALVEILLITGDVPRAAELLKESLAAQPEKAAGILELIGPHLDDGKAGFALHYLFMDAALQAEQTPRVLKTLRTIRGDASRRTELFEWLETKSKEQFLPTDILVLHGEIAIEEEQFGRAIEIFGAVVKNSAPDTPTVLAIVEKHQRSDNRLVEFLKEHAQAHQPAAGQEDGGFEFEHFENNEFRFSGGSADEPAREAAKKETPENDDRGTDAAAQTESPEFSGESIFSSSDEDTEAEKPLNVLEEGLYRAAAEAPNIKDDADMTGSEEDATESRDITDAEAVEAPAPDGAAESVAVDDDDSWFESEKDSIISDGGTAETDQKDSADQSSSPQTPDIDLQGTQPAYEPAEQTFSEEVQNDYEIDEEHVRNLGGALRDTGAALFFHVDDTPSVQPDTETSPAEINEPEPESQSEPEPESQSEPEPAPEVANEYAAGNTETIAATIEVQPEEIASDVDPDDDPGPDTDTAQTDAEDFDTRFGKFLNRELDNDAILALLAEALETGRMEESRDLLNFKPADDEEAFQRKRFQIEYFLAKDLPARALELLTGVDYDTLSRKCRLEILKKQAVCQKRMNDFEGAHNTYLRLFKEAPSPEVEQFARQTYEQYLSNQRERKSVLEKITTLDGD